LPLRKYIIEFSVAVPADSEIKVCFEYKIDRRTEVVIKKEEIKQRLGAIGYEL